jgi:hypothetical protein
MCCYGPRYRALNGLREWLCDNADTFAAEAAAAQASKKAKTEA